MIETTCWLDHWYWIIVMCIINYIIVVHDLMQFMLSACPMPFWLNAHFYPNITSSLQSRWQYISVRTILNRDTYSLGSTMLRLPEYSLSAGNHSARWFIDDSAHSNFRNNYTVPFISFVQCATEQCHHSVCLVSWTIFYVPTHFYFLNDYLCSFLQFLLNMLREILCNSVLVVILEACDHMCCSITWR